METEALIERLKRVKAESNMTYNDIAKLSGIPVSTITRIMSGATPNPQYSTIYAIVTAMGHTMTDVGMERRRSPNENRDVTLAVFQSIVSEKNRWIKGLFIYSVFLTLAIVVLLIFDIVVPSIGFFR